MTARHIAVVGSGALARALGHSLAALAPSNLAGRPDVPVKVGPATQIAVPLPADAPAELAARAAEWLRGGEVTPAAGRRAPLPGYPFQRDRHWIEPPDTVPQPGIRPSRVDDQTETES